MLVWLTDWRHNWTDYYEKFSMESRENEETRQFRDMVLARLVNASATWQPVSILVNWMIWVAIWFQTWWTLSEICFMSLVESLFKDMDFAAVLWIPTVVAVIWDSFWRGWRFETWNTSLCSQVISLTHDDKATYSASPDEWATTIEVWASSE